MRRVLNFILFPLTGLILAGFLYALAGREGIASETERAVWMLLGLAVGIVVAAHVSEVKDADAP